jgi:hypothetical protein
MIRSFAVALVTIVVVSFAGPFGMVAAQSVNATTQHPLVFAGGTPGVSVEIFLNNGKVGDLTLNSTGSGNSILDYGNIGKTRVTIYIDVCKDGKIVKVMFVTGNGQAPPRDESCRSRLAAASYQSDCGAVSINFDLRNFGARAVGCGLSFTDPKVFGPIIGGIVAVPLLLAGGGDSPTPISTPLVPPPPTVVVPATPPVNTTPPAAPPSAPAQPTADSFNGQYTGNLTVTENVCRFTSTAGFSARLNVNSSGTGTLEFTYQSSGQQQLYVFTNVRVTMNGSQGTFEAQTDSAQFGYRLIVQGRLAGTAFTGNISFFDSRPGNCHTGYVVNGSRQ